MPRLKPKEWEKARAEYEVNGHSLREIARQFGISSAAITVKSQKEGWIRNKNEQLINRKVKALKEIEAIEEETERLPLTLQRAIDLRVNLEVARDSAVAEFARKIAVKGTQLLDSIEGADGLETLSRTCRNITPPKTSDATTVNVNAAQAQQQTTTIDVSKLTPEQCSDMIRQCYEGPDK